MALRLLVMLIVFALVLPPLTDAFGIRTLCAFLAHGQEEMSSSTAQNRAQPQILKISLKGAGMLGGDVSP